MRLKGPSECSRGPIREILKLGEMKEYLRHESFDR
jgi:hypothetical protein